MRTQRPFARLTTIAAAAAGGIFFFACCLFGIVAVRLLDHGFATLGEARTIPVLILFALVGTGSVLAGRALLAQVRATRELTEEIARRRVPVSEPVARLVADAGLAGRVDVVDAQDAFSFTYGVARPRVALSSNMIDVCTDTELSAVLHHELYHVRHADPRKVLFARVLPRAFFYLPALSALRDQYVVGRELAADRRALRACGASSLAGTLAKALQGPRWADLRAAAAIGAGDELDARVTQLETGETPLLGGLPRRTVVCTLAAAAVLTGSLAAALVAFGPVIARACSAA